MEWKQVKPEQKNWVEQYALMNGEENHGSVILSNEGTYHMIINGTIFLLTSDDANEAKEEFLEIYDTYLQKKIERYAKLRKEIAEIE